MAGLHALAVTALLASPGDPQVQCGADEVPWRGRCFHRDEWAADEKDCPEGVVVLRKGESRPRCISCEEVEQQQPMNYCASLRARKADAALNRAYQALLKERLRPRQRDLLRSAQRAWLKFREAWCAYSSSGVEGGSVQPMVKSTCWTETTEARTRALEAMASCEEGDLSCPAR